MVVTTRNVWDALCASLFNQCPCCRLERGPDLRGQIQTLLQPELTISYQPYLSPYPAKQITMNHLRLILITGLSLIALSACQESPNETTEDVSEARQDAQEDVSKARSEEAEEVGDAREAAQSDVNEEAGKARRDVMLAEARAATRLPWRNATL